MELETKIVVLEIWIVVLEIRIVVLEIQRLQQLQPVSLHAKMFAHNAPDI